MAIEALSQEYKKEKVTVECKPPTDDWEKYADKLYDLAYEHGKSDALSQEPCEDAIR